MKPILAFAFVSSALLLASCGGDPAPEPQPESGDPRVILGDIEPAANSDVPQSLPTQVGVSLLDNVSAPVDSEGRFALTLPEQIADADLMEVGSALGCFDPAAVQTPTGNQAFPVRYVNGNNGRDYFNKTDGGAQGEDSVKRMRLYAKQAMTVKITPTATCPIAADLTLNAGWNVVEERIPVAEGGRTTYTNTTLPAGHQIFRDNKLFAGSVN